MSSTDILSRLCRRAPRRSQDPQARRRQGRLQAILEIPQRRRAQEVRSQTPGRHREGRRQVISATSLEDIELRCRAEGVHGGGTGAH